VTSIAALLVVVAFMALLMVFGVPRHANQVFARSRQALADMRSDTLGEEEKERAVQGHAIALFGAFALVTLLSALALAVPIGALWLLSLGDLVAFEPVLDATMSWPVLLAATVLGVLLFGMRRRAA